MKNVFLLLLVIAFWSCGNQPSESQETEPTTTKEVTETSTQTDEEASNIILGEGYQIEVTNGELPSPRKEMSTNLGGADITINYGSPSIKGRKIWGGLEPYGEVWRTGANEATTIELSKPVLVEGKELSAGKYALFTIPNEDEWQIIFNGEPDQWGDYKYDETKDILRVTVEPKSIESPLEAMDFVVEENSIVLKWGNLAVPFQVGTNS